MNRTHYIFIDFENVQETDLECIADKQVKVTLVLGERNKNMPVKFVKLIQRFANQVRLVETELNGKNALDFVLAHEIGVQSEQDGAGYFHILSRDKGFDALIRDLKGKEIKAARHVAFSEIPVLMNADERIRHVGARFKLNPQNRPKKRKTLESQIHSVFGKRLLPEEIEQVIAGLISANTISFTDKGDVIYKEVL
jgi:hypothetical protein